MQQRVTVAPLMADAGVVGVMITLEDVTERLDRERSRRRAHRAAGRPASPNVRAALASDDWRVRERRRAVT